MDVVYGTFTMTGGEISNNWAYKGGGVNVSESEFIMTGGAVTGNTARRGGENAYVVDAFMSVDTGVAVFLRRPDGSFRLVKESADIIRGYEDNTLRPTATATKRAQKGFIIWNIPLTTAKGKGYNYNKLPATERKWLLHGCGRNRHAACGGGSRDSHECGRL